MTDKLEGHQPSLISPPISGEAVTPNDSADLTYTAKSLWVGTPGTLVVTLAGDSTSLTYVGVAGSFNRKVSRVWATGTTASDIIAEYQ